MVRADAAGFHDVAAFDETFEADPETEKMLLEAMAQCWRGRVMPLKDFLAEMRSRE